MRIAILGLGAMGSVIAWKLKKQGHQILSARSGRAFIIERNGQTLAQLNLNAWQDEPIDWLIICTKAGQTIDAIAPILPKANLIKQVLCIQNGMGQHRQLSRELPTLPIWAGISTEGAYRLDAHKIEYAAEGRTLIGPLIQPLKAILSDVPDPLEMADNIDLIMLNKLAVNAVINPLTAYFKCPNGQLLSDKYKADFVKLCHEIQTLYQALNWPAFEPFIQKVAQIAKQTEANRSSSLQDVLAGRKTELAYISGYLIGRAKEINHPMPLSEFYLQQLDY